MPTTDPTPAAPAADSTPAAPAIAVQLAAHLDKVAGLIEKHGKDSPAVRVRYPVTADLIAEMCR